MSCGSCSYDCSLEQGITQAVDVCPNADVSGIGVGGRISKWPWLIDFQVVLGYTINAGIVVVIILVNYLLAFQPDADPFLEAKPGAQPRPDFKPNPIDVLVIRFVREKCGMKSKLGKRVEEALMKVGGKELPSHRRH